MFIISTQWMFESKETATVKRPLLGFAAAGISALLLTACAAEGAGGGSSGDGEPIKLAVVYGLTGAYAGTGKVFMDGVDAAVKDINGKGGVDGRQLEVKLIDDKSDPTFAVSALTDLLDSGYEPDVIVPGGVSTEALALLPMTTDAPLFSISPATSPVSNDPGTYPYHFGISVPKSVEQETVIDDLKAKGAKTLAVVLPGDAFGDSVLTGIKAAAKAGGIEIVAVERPSPAALNYTVEYDRVKSAKPDAVFSDFAVRDAVARLFEARLTVGATDIPMYNGAGTSGSSVPSALVDGPALKNCSLVVPKYSVKTDAPASYLKPLYAAFVGRDGSIFPGGLGWDTVHVAALAVERAGGDTEAEALTAALTSEEIPPNVLSSFIVGTRYTDKDHFPEARPDNFTTVPCAATQADGLWVE